MILSRSAFLQKIEQYLEAADMPHSTFGRKALGDPLFVTEVRRGRSCGLDIVEKVMTFISDNPPPKRRRAA